MKITLLGSGGVSPIPRPTCFCEICEEARGKGIPYARTGPSLFIHDMDLLIDTPEEIKEQLNREKIKNVKNVILTHWHPDHTMGMRILEQINWDYKDNKPFSNPINVYISDEQLEFLKANSSGRFLEHYESKGIAKVCKLASHDSLKGVDVSITPYPIRHTKGFYFLIQDGTSKIVYAPCEYHKFLPDPAIKEVDIFIVHNLFWNNPEISPRKRKPENEDSFEEMLKHADSFGAKNIILMHIEESFGLSHDALAEKMKKYYPDYNIVPGYDGLLINI